MEPAAAAEIAADHLDSSLSLVRYISWAIPAIGFIGTVRGIGEALAQADKAVQGDIAGVTQSLGVAFNSTFIALLISIFLMFLVHQLQLLQERLVYDAETIPTRSAPAANRIGVLSITIGSFSVPGSRTAPTVGSWGEDRAERS